MGLKKFTKRVMVHSPIKYSERLDSLFRLTLIKQWVAQHEPHAYFTKRKELFAHIAQTAIGDRPISLLEFGVYRGDSLRSWTKLNRAAQSEFVGFDSFEGLPEAWKNVRSTLERGTFSTSGILPVFDDPRVRLVKGWFQDTLPAFLDTFSADKQIVVNLDADVYSSTLFVLCKLDAVIRPGAIAIFGDFSSMLHDFRALEDYTRAFNRQYEVLGAAGRSYYEHVAIRFTS